MPAANKAPDLERPASRNRFDPMEWASARGDLGTLIPFVVAYIGLLKMDPYGILLAFGVAKIVSRIYYRTPFIFPVHRTFAWVTCVIKCRGRTAEGPLPPGGRGTG